MKKAQPLPRTGLESLLIGAGYNPSLRAEFFLNKPPSRRYRLTICTDLCTVCLIIDRSDVPAIAARIGVPGAEGMASVLARVQPGPVSHSAPVKAFRLT
jgi:hypothetical protein